MTVPSTKFYAVVGRIPYDDEDSCFIFEAPSEEHACEEFTAAIYAAKSRTDQASVAKDNDGASVYINHVLVSDTPISNQR